MIFMRSFNNVHIIGLAVPRTKEKRANGYGLIQMRQLKVLFGDRVNLVVTLGLTTCALVFLLDIQLVIIQMQVLVVSYAKSNTDLN